jgi:hypothetical protein
LLAGGLRRSFGLGTRRIGRCFGFGSGGVRRIARRLSSRRSLVRSLLRSCRSSIRSLARRIGGRLCITRRIGGIGCTGGRVLRSLASCVDLELCIGERGVDLRLHVVEVRLEIREAGFDLGERVLGPRPRLIERCLRIRRRRFRSIARGLGTDQVV